MLASYWFKKGVHEKPNRAFEWMKRKYAVQLDWALNRPKTTMLIATLIFGATLLLVPFIGGEFMPHLDEGALWVRATMPYTISFEEASSIAPQIRDILMSYPQVTVVGSELGRPDDGTDATGFFNCEFYVGLKPYKDKSWTGEVSDKKQLIESINKKLTAFPGIIFNYTQPAEDAVDEALTGLKSSLAVKIYGEDLNVLQDKAIQIKNALSNVRGFTELTVVRELGQPSLLVDVDRDKIARYGINVADVEAVISAAVGGQAVTQVIQGEKLFDLVVRMQPQFRSSAHEIGNLLVGTPDGQQIPLSQLANITQGNGASFIYRENNSRYIGVQYSIEGRDLERAVRDGQAAVKKAVILPPGYTMSWGGEYSQFLEAKSQMYFIGPLAVVLIFMILFALYGNFKFPVTIALGVVMTEPVGALVALKLTHTPFSVSSVLGLLALLGVSVETAVILVSYINKLRQEGMSIHEATREASLLRLRPIMMTALVACLGIAACGSFHWHRIGYAKAVCHSHRCRPHLPPLHRLLCQPCVVRDGCARGRCATGLEGLSAAQRCYGLREGDGKQRSTCKIPVSSIFGVGGQPGIYPSTGMTASTGPTTAWLPPKIPPLQPHAPTATTSFGEGTVS